MAGGQGRAGNGRRQKKKLNSENAMCDLKTARRLEPIVLCSLAGGKTHTLLGYM